jgi:hypothetical protein
MPFQFVRRVFARAGRIVNFAVSRSMQVVLPVGATALQNYSDSPDRLAPVPG